MSETSPPAFQFYPKDFLADTLAMPVETRGVYITLLCYQWVNGSIPESPVACARICSLSVDEITEHFQHLDEKFIENIEHKGTRVNPRMERERQKQSRFRKSRAKAGRASGRARSNKTPTKSNSSSSSSSSSSDKKHTSAPQTGLEHPFVDAPDKPPKPDKKNGPPPCPLEKIVELYHEHLPERPRVKVLSEARKKHLRARWREDEKRQKLKWWQGYFEYIHGQPFLMGEGGRESWGGIDFDFVIRQSSLIKIIEGKYEQ